MVTVHYIRLVLAVLTLIIASWTDIKTHKVYNWLTFPMMGVGLVLCFFDGITGMTGRLVICFALFLLGTFSLIGLGDIKLDMALVCLLGARDGIFCFLYGALLAFVVYFIKKPLLSMQAVRQAPFSFVNRETVAENSKNKFAFAPYIAAGFVINIIIGRIFG